MGELTFAVYGTGAVGGYFGGRLAEAGHDVRFIARGRHLAAIREHGLRVSSVDGDFLIRPAQAAADPAVVGQVDVILLGVKAWQVPEAAGAIGPLLGDRSVVVPLQNGVEAPDQLAAVLGPGRLLGGLCRILAYLSSDGLTITITRARRRRECRTAARADPHLAFPHPFVPTGIEAVDAVP